MEPNRDDGWMISADAVVHAHSKVLNICAHFDDNNVIQHGRGTGYDTVSINQFSFLKRLEISDESILFIV